MQVGRGGQRQPVKDSMGAYLPQGQDKHGFCERLDWEPIEQANSPASLSSDGDALRESR